MSNGHHQILRVRMTRGVGGVRSGSHFHLPEEKKKNKIATGTSSPLHTHQTELNCRTSKKEIFILVNAVG
jgi:hypothetical protein